MGLTLRRRSLRDIDRSRNVRCSRFHLPVAESALQAGPLMKEVKAMTKMVSNGDVELATQAFGDPADPPVLLIMGAMASMLWWPEDFCRALAARGRFVIRYDNRDTGLSTVYEPGKASYSMEDMADDAVAVLDGYGLDSAHVAGMSLGGMIAQLVAFGMSERVSTLTLISTSPMGVDTGRLPGMSEAYKQHGAEGEKVDWSDLGQVIDYVVKDTRMIASTRHPYDGAAARRFVEQDAARARNFLSTTNHFLVDTKRDWSGCLARLRVPLLVMHGTSDPLFPIEHGREIARIAPLSRFVAIDGGGHELHPLDWPRMSDELAANSATE